MLYFYIDIDRDDNEHPQSVAMSKVLRFYGGAKPKKSLLAITTSKKGRQRTNSVMSTSASIRSLTPTSKLFDLISFYIRLVSLLSTSSHV